jgi:hypothetical protein
MGTIVTVKNQTLIDIAVQEYGNASAWEEILDLNPSIRNDYSSALEAGITYYPDEFDIAFPIEEGFRVQVDEQSSLVRMNNLRELGSSEIISFNGID